MLRLTLGLFAAAFFLFIIAFMTSCVSCLRYSAGCSSTSGTVVLFAASFCVAAIGVFHGYLLMEEDENKDIWQPPFGYKRVWSNLLRENTTQTYAWSYIVTWVGIFLVLLSVFFFYFAGCAMKGAKRKKEKQMVAVTRYTAPAYAAPYEKSLPRQGGATMPPPIYYDKRGQPVYDSRGTLVYSNQAYTAPHYGPYYYGHK
ncbi:PREDICTED: uncharacterized protein LOC106817577 [Priapulus caudatus]|uniref:Uncharacterized protein LOC106817577 n=1 Tax=Priapulus caudatus TaxID=37621 RepID=A0ABM1EZW7_PRICU|nr:PREDICTED: uncharacterized protein LOC106817577 [Priapulus caudatus]